MRFMYGGFIAVAIALFINPVVEKIWGLKAILGAIPLVEEGVKTLIAIYLGVNIVGVHVVFGMIEGLYDVLRPTRTGHWSALLSIAGHTLFGMVTWGLIKFHWPVYGVIILVALMHSLWNMFMVTTWLK